MAGAWALFPKAVLLSVAPVNFLGGKPIGICRIVCYNIYEALNG